MFWSDNKRVIIKSKRHRLKLSKKKKKNPNTLETCLIILLKKKKKKNQTSFHGKTQFWACRLASLEREIKVKA